MTGLAMRVGKITQRAATIPNASIECGSDGSMQLLNLIVIQGITGSQWVEARPPECLIGIDIANSRYNMLIQQ